jgi:aminopeptidase N
MKLRFAFSYCLLLMSISNFAQENLCKQNFVEREIQSYQNLFRETNQNASAASNNFDVNYYRCVWEITPNVRYIKGNVTAVFKMLTTGNNVVVDLLTALTVDSIKYKGNNIAFTRPANAVSINFPAAIAANATDSFTIYYQGAPPTTEGYYATGTHGGAPITWTLSEPYGAKYWWPCKDNLVDKADSMDIYIIHLSAYKASTNGKLMSETPSGANTITHWKHKYPIVSYLVAFAVTNYSLQNLTLTSNGSSMNFKNYVYPESVTIFNNSIANINAGFAYLEQKFGPYPFNNEQYAQTQAGPGIGGMEHQTNSFIDNFGTDLMVHELAHQWFGDMVTCGSWQDIWLNEGYASYAEILNTENSNGIAARTSRLQSTANNITSVSTGSVYCTDTVSVGSIFNYRMSYLKGAYTLHMLRWLLGDTKFFQATRNYLNAPGIKYAFARTDSLKKYMELQYGASLTNFFNDWVYGQGYPSYTVRWNQNATTFNTVLQLSQTSSNASVSYYEMPVPIKFRGATKDTTVICNLTTNGQIFTYPLSFPFFSIEFDPEAWILSRNNSLILDPTLVTTGVNTIVNDSKIKLGPSPTRDNIYITNTGNRLLKEVQITDAQGKVVLSKPLVGVYTISVKSFAAGTYFVKLIDNNKQIIVKKFVKE